MGTVQHIEELRIWQNARKICKSVYAASETKPFASDWELRGQIRRSAISVVSNIAEGFERDGNPEFVQFLLYAKGSVGELRTQLYIAEDLAYIDTLTNDDLQRRCKALAAGIAMLIITLQRSGHLGPRHRKQFQVE